MSKIYSIAIYPFGSVMDEVRALKDELASLIGWYGSRNSKAHITIGEFEADLEGKLDSIKSQLRKLCETEFPLDLRFDHVGAYEKGTNSVICILPDNESETILKPLMKRIQKGLKVKLTYNSSNPHITIGRKLDEEKLSVANTLFKDKKIKLNFCCDRIVLRVREGNSQFLVIEEFVFQSKPSSSSDEQLSMF
ncbi:2'-5' RNA ligase family protein [Pedobacter foliorum]|uniref:2'-5' RNA ligase family protein n=1 Tax=Pedobacter foliorum TaxID=2739058 RepID=UPI00156458C7|nr:2'-5' RNA ligase family protein [Pedobacter foliorum]NRF41841.1 2'-5' RNA ligase family protein [Pedobacter foliorum]